MAQDSEELAEISISEKQLKFWDFWLRWRKKVFLGLKIFLIILNLFFWGFFIYKAIWEVALISFQEKSGQILASGFLPWQKFIEEKKPQDIEWRVFQYLETSKGSGLVVELLNPDTSSLAYFDFAFSLGGQKERGRDFLLPTQHKYLVYVFKEKGTPEFQIENISRQRILAREINGDLSSFYSDRLNFVYENLEFSRPSGDLPARVTFLLRNQTAFNYYNPHFYLVFWRGDEIIDIEKISLPKFLSGSTEKIELNLPNSLKSFSQMELIPDINVFDKNSYLVSL